MSDLTFYVNLIACVGLLPTHLALGASRSRFANYLLAVMVVCWLLYWLGLSFGGVVRFRDALLGLASYCVSLFVLLSELLMFGGGQWLTRRCGDQWTEELDYVYLAIGVALVATLGKLENVSDRFEVPPALGPFLVATAFVLRAIKTRAEIAGWNKAPMTSP